MRFGFWRSGPSHKELWFGYLSKTAKGLRHYWVEATYGAIGSEWPLLHLPRMTLLQMKEKTSHKNDTVYWTQWILRLLSFCKDQSKHAEAILSFTKYRQMLPYSESLSSQHLKKAFHTLSLSRWGGTWLHIIWGHRDIFLDFCFLGQIVLNFWIAFGDKLVLPVTPSKLE